MHCSEVFWWLCGRQPLVSVGAVFSLLDGLTGCDPAFVLFGSGFVCCVGTW